MMAIRILIIGAILVIAIATPWDVPLIPAILGAQLAYDGLVRRSLAIVVGLLMIIEFVFGLDLGILSLSYLLVAALVVLFSRVIAMTPWTHADGWQISDALRAWIISCILAVACIAASVLIGALYGSGALASRFTAELAPERLWMLLPVCALFLVVFRRTDIPFRRTIRFGV